MNLPRSGVLVLGSNSIQSLLPATLSAQVESLLQNHRIPDAADLAEKKRVKLQGQRVVDDDEVRIGYPRPRIPYSSHFRGMSYATSTSA
jgi:hypothetical protein